MQVEVYKFESEFINTDKPYVERCHIKPMDEVGRLDFYECQNTPFVERLPVRESIVCFFASGIGDDSLDVYVNKMQKRGFILSGDPIKRKDGLEYRFVKRYVLDKNIQERLIDPQIDAIKREYDRNVSSLHDLLSNSNYEVAKLDKRLKEIKSLPWWKRLFKIGF